MLDRLDLQIEVPAVTSTELMEAEPGKPSAAVRECVVAAREVQRARGHLNARLPHPALQLRHAAAQPSWVKGSPRAA